MFFYLQQFCLELALIDNGNASPESDVGRHIFCHRATEQLFISLATITELVLRLEHPSVRSSAIQSILHSVSQNALDSLGLRYCVIQSQLFFSADQLPQVCQWLVDLLAQNFSISGRKYSYLHLPFREIVDASQRKDWWSVVGQLRCAASESPFTQTVEVKISASSCCKQGGLYGATGNTAFNTLNVNTAYPPNPNVPHEFYGTQYDESKFVVDTPQPAGRYIYPYMYKAEETPNTLPVTTPTYPSIMPYDVSGHTPSPQPSGGFFQHVPIQNQYSTDKKETEPAFPRSQSHPTPLHPFKGTGVSSCGSHLYAIYNSNTSSTTVAPKLVPSVASEPTLKISSQTVGKAVAVDATQPQSAVPTTVLHPAFSGRHQLDDVENEDDMGSSMDQEGDYDVSPPPPGTAMDATSLHEHQAPVTDSNAYLSQIVPVRYKNELYVPIYASIAYIVGSKEPASTADARRWLNRAPPNLHSRNDENLPVRVSGALPRVRYTKLTYVERLLLNNAAAEAFIPNDRLNSQRERQAKWEQLQRHIEQCLHAQDQDLYKMLSRESTINERQFINFQGPPLSPTSTAPSSRSSSPARVHPM